MGESLGDSASNEDKDFVCGSDTTPMREKASPLPPALEVSVSFGRFENDSLSWEKWSTFSPNKYLEEVEKFATPGSVAQKKAYFEAHYKKIFAQKAEQLMEQEKKTESELKLELDTEVEPTKTVSYGVGELNDFSGQCSYEEEHGDDSAITIEYEEVCTEKSYVVNQEMKTEIESVMVNNGRDGFGLSGYSDRCSNEEERDDATGESSLVNRVKEEEANPDLDLLELAKTEETVLVKEGIDETSFEVCNGQFSKEQEQDGDSSIIVECENSLLVKGVSDELDQNSDLVVRNEFEETSAITSKAIEEMPKDTEKPEASSSKVKGISKLDNFKNSSVKVTKKSTTNNTAPLNKERNITTVKKKPAPPITVSPKHSTLKQLKPQPKVTSTPASRYSIKNENISSVSKSKNSLVGGTNKKATPKSLHMSLSIGPSDSNVHSVPAPAVPSTTRKSFIMETMGDKDIVRRAFKTFQNNYNQLKSPVVDSSSSPKQVSAAKGTRVAALVNPRKENGGGSRRVGVVERKSSTAVPSSDKRNELLRKSDKANAPEAKKKQVPRKTKEEDRLTDIKRLSQSVNFKATPMPDFYRRQKIATSSLDKEGLNNKTRR